MGIIQTEALTKAFGSQKAVDCLTFSVKKGEIFGLVGPDGAGKTTTMRLLASIMDPSSGSATILNFDSVKESEQIKRKIGYMSQRFGLYPDLTVLENLTFYADIYSVPKGERTKIFDKLLHFSNLDPFKDRLADNLSGGMKQKLALACALVHTPDILFLDEPTNGVDPVSRRDFWRILYQMHEEGVTIFFSTAYLDEAERCERLAFLFEGKMMAYGTPEEVKALQKGVIVETITEKPRQALIAIRSIFGADAVRLFGNSVHTIVQNAASDISKIKSALEEAQIPFTQSEVVEPTLEDVFISLSLQYAAN